MLGRRALMEQGEGAGVIDYRILGRSGSAQGAGIWNGVLFGGPTSPLTLRNSKVTGNTLSGSPGITLQGGGIFTPGFPTTLTNSIVAHNTPDQCFGCG